MTTTISISGVKTYVTPYLALQANPKGVLITKFNTFACVDSKQLNYYFYKGFKVYNP